MKRMLQDTGIMKKILAMMLLLGTVAVITAAVNAWKVRSVDAAYSELVEQRMPAIPLLVRSLRQVSQGVFHGLQVLSFPAGSEQSRNAAEELRNGFAEASESLRKAEEFDPELKPSVEAYRSRMQRIFEMVDSAVQLGRAGQQGQALQRLSEADAKLTELIDDMVRANNQRMADAARMSDELSSSADHNALIALILSIVFTAMALLMAHRVVKKTIIDPLLELNGQMGDLAKGHHALTIANVDRADEIGSMSRAVAVFRDQAEERARLEEEKRQSAAEQEHVVKTLGTHLDELAAGDLSTEIKEHFPHSYRQLRMAFNAAIQSLGGLIKSVSDSTAEIRTGSGEIAQASEDLARRTESNAASLEETSAAVAQMDGRLKASAASATETVGRADQAIATVSGGRAVADEAVQAMGRVSESAKGIDSVIEGLDKIAFQTRVLAMNAAVEAGRAGEAGRGFAVVADLVSALAMRAEEEAKRARDQLTVTQTDIVTAVDAVGQVDTALQNISADVGEVHQLLASMASDNQAQAMAITEINAAIASMDQSTQQNAAMVEQTSAAARNLLSEVTGLSEQASRFRCRSDGKVAAAAAAPRPKPAATTFPRLGKEGSYKSPITPLPAAAVESLTRPSAAQDDWNEF